jgi:hypothetical protein
MEIFATIIANEEQKMAFETDLARNNILLKVMTPDIGDEYHYSLEGDINGYEELMKNVGVYTGDRYTITSLEHFQE